ncbi:hypothetical protein EST38_g5946 [Candolleomyces aberdarensis]|uniref:F-box domain-containing protein n=1 Tax=Candolleomyces aberdarensis TaxID=2316362 RepID=A0A4V1Q3V4_9AGAR|nr:hypothetical protein EST38_g5946 [Candolleomyces aberdarensis]
MRDHELVEIDAQLSILQDRIAHIEADLDEKKREYDGLMAKRVEFAPKLCRLAGDLPTETISQIVEAAVFSLNDPVPRLQQLTNIRLLDSRWNRIVLGNPSFWKEVTLIIGNEHQWRCAIDRTEKRIGEIPKLHVHIEMKHDDPNLLPDDIVTFLSSNASKVATFSIQTAVRFYKIMAQIMHQYPAIFWTSLSSAKIFSSKYQQNDGSASDIFLSPKHFPALHELEVNAALPLNADFWEFLGVPWSQLTSLTIGGSTSPFSDCFVNLSKCVGGLEHLSIAMDELSFGYYPRLANSQTFTFSRLRSIVLHVAYRCDPLGEFFHRLIVPALESLKYTDDVQYIDPAFPCRMLDAFASMVERSSCRLLEVKIQLNDRSSLMDKDALFRFLRSTPYLKIFNLSVPNLSGAFLLDMEDHQFVQNLERFSLTALRPHVDSRVLMKNFSKWGEKRVKSQANTIEQGERGDADGSVSTNVDRRCRLEARLCVEEVEVVRTIRM